jgi:hypothetical protein
LAADLPVGSLGRRIWLLAAYVLPAIAIWMALGVLANVLPLSTVALVVMAGCGAYYGVLEAAGRARPAAPGSRWQVPSAWVRGVSRRRRFVVWGSLLGPGFATRNPYAGFWLLPLAVAAVGSIGYRVSPAACIGAADSTGRVLGLLRDVHGGDVSSDLQSSLTSMYWRMADGLALLAAAGAAVMTCRYRL